MSRVKTRTPELWSSSIAARLLARDMPKDLLRTLPKSAGHRARVLQPRSSAFSLNRVRLHWTKPVPVMEWQAPDDPRRRKIKVRDLLNMSSGLEFQRLRARADLTTWSASERTLPESISIASTCSNMPSINRRSFHQARNSVIEIPIL